MPILACYGQLGTKQESVISEPVFLVVLKFPISFLLEVLLSVLLLLVILQWWKEVVHQWCQGRNVAVRAGAPFVGTL